MSTVNFPSSRPSATGLADFLKPRHERARRQRAEAVARVTVRFTSSAAGSIFLDINAGGGCPGLTARGTGGWVRGLRVTEPRWPRETPAISGQSRGERVDARGRVCVAVSETKQIVRYVP